ncbi:hypothetical protein SAMN05421747_12211 [Parapedobacter composti]|uniref:Uncharacterized protein n=1 Tax=Parapedobacter composti TaxID=623281 RepID=A0A1I1LLB7_9SPHI|nr:hypothetical protein SAMN05421747_12211 [Parapedobacter composti]
MEFQFLYGAIKGSQKSAHDRSRMNFNSCMVRLKGRKYITKSYMLLNFNSCMVRLKGKPSRNTFNQSQFQFLYGAIKGRWPPP